MTILPSTATVSALVRRLAPALVALAFASPAVAAGIPSHEGTPVQALRSQSLDGHHALVELNTPLGGGARFALHAVGARLLSPQLALWRLPSAATGSLLPALRARGLVRSVTPDVRLQPLRVTRSLDLCPDPMCPQEWWWSTVGADRWTSPGPGFPVTMIDSGADLSHPDFLNRPNATALNTQTFSTAYPEELHGTATASVVGAQAGGGKLVGIYPQAKLQVWDASPSGVLTVGDEIAGLSSAIAHGPGVINLSLGGSDRLAIEEHAILSAFGSGSLVVASAGNGRQEGSPPSYPAAFAHVLTIGATDESNRVTYFSTASTDMDLAAPGQNIPVAIPQAFASGGGTGDPYGIYDGTSFSAPLVSGAAAGVWTQRPTLTNTQLFEVMRRSARGGGWNRNTGYGILDAPAALVRKAPLPDPEEPNEDVFLVKPHGLFRAGHPALTSPGHPHATVRASMERGDDPEDVYRAYLPAHGRLVVNAHTSANVNLEVWGRKTRTVYERGAAAKRDLLGVSAHAGARPERIVVKGRGVGQYVYVDVFLAKTPRDAGYKLNLSTARR
jgi:Subtilase family